MPTPAELIRDLSVAVIGLGKNDPDLMREHHADPSMSTELWYERYCLLISQMVEIAAKSCELECEVVLGLFVGQKEKGRYPRPLQHAWLEVPDGTIIDPTSAQVGLNESAVIEPDNEIHRHYRMRGWWTEGDGPPPPG